MERRFDKAKRRKERPGTKIAGLISTPDFRKIVEDVYKNFRDQELEFKKKKLEID
jgi:hypothetical protein